MAQDGSADAPRDPETPRKARRAHKDCFTCFTCFTCFLVLAAFDSRTSRRDLASAADVLTAPLVGVELAFLSASRISS